MLYTNKLAKYSFTFSVSDLLHKISREIVEKAKKENALIMPGDLKGTRKQDRGRRFNRKLNAFPYYRLSKFIEYKASWEGIAVIKIKENGTSKHCSRYGSQGLRRGGRFVSECGLELNADYNGALNILKRALGYMLRAGAGLTQPEPGRMKLRRQTGNLPALAVESVNRIVICEDCGEKFRQRICRKWGSMNFRISAYMTMKDDCRLIFLSAKNLQRII